MNNSLKESISIIYLKKLYKKRFKEDKEISEKDIIYFLRDSMSHLRKNYTNILVKPFYEKEILNLIKAKDWDWHYTDIDNCNILTYSIFNKVDSIADYLIENKYDLSIYTKDVSNALCASIRINNIDYFKKIVNNEDLNSQYFIDLNIHSYKWRAINPINFEIYNKYLNSLEKTHKTETIYKITENIINLNHDFDKFLEHQEFDNEIFIEIVDKILNDKTIDMHKSKSDKLISSFSKYRLYHDLNKNLLNKKNNQSKKI